MTKGRIARNLTDCDSGFLIGTRYLIHDRDPLFTDRFREILKSCRVKTVELPARSSNLNAHAERFVRSVKSECWASFACHSAAPIGSLVLCAFLWASVTSARP
jgi:hypothetical protein